MFDKNLKSGRNEIFVIIFLHVFSYFFLSCAPFFSLLQLLFLSFLLRWHHLSVSGRLARPLGSVDLTGHAIEVNMPPEGAEYRRGGQFTFFTEMQNFTSFAISIKRNIKCPRRTSSYFPFWFCFFSWRTIHMAYIYLLHGSQYEGCHPLVD